MLSSRAHQAARSTGETRIYQTLDVDPIYEEVTGVGLGGQRRRTESLARRGHEQEIEVAPAEGNAATISSLPAMNPKEPSRSGSSNGGSVPRTHESSRRHVEPSGRDRA